MAENNVEISKEYPVESKAKLEAMIEETKKTREELDKLDDEIRYFTGSPSKDVVTRWGRVAVGSGNYLRKKLGKIVSALRNEEANRYLTIKIYTQEQGIKITESYAQEEATAYVAPLRTAKNILEAYVVSSDNVISICRMHLSSLQIESTVEL